MDGSPSRRRRWRCLGDLGLCSRGRGDEQEPLSVPSSSREVAARAGFLLRDFLAPVDGDRNAAVLVALIDGLRPGGPSLFSRFLASVLRWVRGKSTHAMVQKLFAFLMSGGIAGAFAVHFLPLRRWKAGMLTSGAPVVSCGLCVIHGANKSIPLLLVYFISLPSYFQSLHVAMMHRSRWHRAVKPPDLSQQEPAEELVHRKARRKARGKPRRKPVRIRSLKSLYDADPSDVSRPVGPKWKRKRSALKTVKGVKARLNLADECLERNSRGKTIPIPGVCNVSDYTEHIVSVPFVQPGTDYCKMWNNELERALINYSIYDMDSEDEEWLSDEQKLLFGSYFPEEFEKIITSFEKAAFNNPKEIKDVDRLLSRCQGLGKDYLERQVYEHWINKRNKKGVALLRFFQQPDLSQESAFKNLASLKRQRSQQKRRADVSLVLRLPGLGTTEVPLQGLTGQGKPISLQGFFQLITRLYAFL